MKPVKEEVLKVKWIFAAPPAIESILSDPEGCLFFENRLAQVSFRIIKTKGDESEGQLSLLRVYKIDPIREYCFSFEKNGNIVFEMELDAKTIGNLRRYTREIIFGELNKMNEIALTYLSKTVRDGNDDTTKIGSVVASHTQHYIE